MSRVITSAMAGTTMASTTKVSTIASAMSAVVEIFSAGASR
jgi:hypothetical protein